MVDPNILKLKKYIFNLKIESIGFIKVKDWISKLSLMNNFKSANFINGNPYENISQCFKNKNINKILYIFELSDEKKKWKIYKSLDDFIEFEKKLKLNKIKNLKNTNQQLKFLNKYFKLKNIFIKNYSQFLFFIENNQYVLENNLKSKGELVIKKKPGGQFKYGFFKNLFNRFIFYYHKRTFIFLKYGVFYVKYNKKKLENKEMLFFNEKTKFEYFNKKNYIIIIINFDNRILKLKFENIITYIKFHMILNQLDIFNLNNKKRYNSFAPIRNNIFFEPILLGDSYFSKLYEELISAKKVVYILDWWLCAHLYLKRPIELNKNSRLDKVLLRLAEKNVKIYIILYKEMRIVWNNNSLFTMKYLNNLHKNIYVIRHPNGIINYWSHHEKIVIIDKKVGFLGGIDLCFGRYESNKYSLKEISKDIKETYFLGKDYSNPRIKDFYDIEKFKEYQFETDKTPRMPWRDIGIKLKGKVIKDLCFHFIEYWNHAKVNQSFSNFIFYKKESNTIIRNTILNRNQTNKLKNDNKYNFLKIFDDNDFKNKNKSSRNLSISKKKKKSLKSSFSKKRKIKNLFKFNFNFRKTQMKNADNVLDYNNNFRTTFLNQYNEKNKGQILRSVSNWSIGYKKGINENSIYNSYKDLIKNAKNFIYIENQFLISNTNKNNNNIVKNDVSKFIFDKLKEKIQNNEKFKLIVMLPLLPGFEGNLESDNKDIFLMVLNFQLSSIYGRKDSFYRKLINRFGKEKLKDYIIFLSMRNHTVMNNGLPVTEIIYIHSKLIIVDDKKMIIGSANLNDRSLLGNRDSELVVIIENNEKNNDIFKFRIKIWKDIFGIEEEFLNDPMNDNFFKKLRENCKINENFYRTVFGIFPDNKMKSFKEYEDIKNKKDIDKYHELAKNLKGLIVKYPYKFLEKENLNEIPLNFKTKFVSKELFT